MADARNFRAEENTLGSLL